MENSPSHPVDEASLALCHASSVVSVLEAIFGEPVDLQYLEREDVYGSLALVSHLIIKAKNEIDSIGLCPLPSDHPAHRPEGAHQ